MFKPNKVRKYISNFPSSKFFQSWQKLSKRVSHGYNILTGESFPQQAPTSKKTPKNINNPTNFNLEGYNLPERSSKTQYPREINQNNDIISNKEKEDLSQSQA